MLCHAEAAKPVFPCTSFKLQRAARFTQREPLCPKPEPGVLLATVTTTRRAETSSGMSVSLRGNLGEASTLSQAATFMASFCVSVEECGEGSPRPGLLLPWCFPEEESRCCSHFQLRGAGKALTERLIRLRKPLGERSDVWAVSRKVVFLPPWNLC